MTDANKKTFIFVYNLDFLGPKSDSRKLIKEQKEV